MTEEENVARETRKRQREEEQEKERLFSNFGLQAGSARLTPNLSKHTRVRSSLRPGSGRAGVGEQANEREIRSSGKYVSEIVDV